MKLAKKNTDRNLETCGVLAGSLVSANKYFVFDLKTSNPNVFTYFISTEKQKILCDGSHYS